MSEMSIDYDDADDDDMQVRSFLLFELKKGVVHLPYCASANFMDR